MEFCKIPLKKKNLDIEQLLLCFFFFFLNRRTRNSLEHCSNDSKLSSFIYILAQLSARQRMAVSFRFV
jgi:hypothetical protein